MVKILFLLSNDVFSRQIDTFLHFFYSIQKSLKNTKLHLSLVIDFEVGGSCRNRLFVAPKYYYAEVISLPNREEKLRKKVQGRRKADCDGPNASLCSRNFQNVKLRLDFVEIDYFTATQILREIQFRRIQMVQRCHFWQFQRL